MRKNKLICIAIAAVLLLPASVLVHSEAQALTWRVGSNCPVDSPTHKAMDKLAELVKKKSDGKFEIKVFPANMLGGNTELMEMLKSGALEIQISGASELGVLGISEYYILKIPYIWENLDHLYKFFDSDVNQALMDKTLDKAGIRIVDHKWNRMPRHVSGNKPIWGLKELQGFKIRCGDRGSVEGFRVLGAAPVNIPLNEMYLALKQNVADGANLPLDYFFDNSIYEANEYLNMTYHTIETQQVRVNEKKFQALSDSLKKVFLDAVKESGAYNNQLTDELEDEYTYKLQKAGMKLVMPNKREIKEAIVKNAEKVNSIYPEAEKNFFQKVQKFK